MKRNPIIIAEYAAAGFALLNVVIQACNGCLWRAIDQFTIALLFAALARTTKLVSDLFALLDASKRLNILTKRSLLQLLENQIKNNGNSRNETGSGEDLHL